MVHGDLECKNHQCICSVRSSEIATLSPETTSQRLGQNTQFCVIQEQIAADDVFIYNMLHVYPRYYMCMARILEGISKSHLNPELD